MPTKNQIIIIFGVLCVVAFGLGYWDGMPEKDSGQRAEWPKDKPWPHVFGTLEWRKKSGQEVVTNIVTLQPPVKAEFNPIIEAAIRKAAKKPTGELTKADLEKVTGLNLYSKQLTDVPKGLEKLTQLEYLDLNSNQLTDVKGLEKLTKLTVLYLYSNQLTSVKGLEKLTKLEVLTLQGNQLTDVKELEKLMQLVKLRLQANPALTKAQIDQLQKALPKCDILSNPAK